jgi:DNA topoisomerase-6 subunit B
MAVKEAVDNSLDACEEADILPELAVKIKQTGEDKYIVSVQDNGPGIVAEQIPNIFGKLLYGSKFHRLRQGRGQQGIGISAVLLYSQLTTGKPTRVWSRTDEKKNVQYFELLMNTQKNQPQIMKREELKDGMAQGTKVEMEIVGRYRKKQGIDDYLKQTSIANPFAKISYSAPDGTKMTFPKSHNELPKPPKEIKMHPYGVEFGVLLRMLGSTKSRTILGFLTNEFSSIGTTTGKEICKVAKLDPDMQPTKLDRTQIEKLLEGMQKVKVQRPPLDCLSPIGENELEKSLKKEFPNTEFVTVITREPSVYKGNPFQIEVGIIYGFDNEEKIDEDDEEDENQIQIMRLANRVPLLYQAGACATIEAVKNTAWKRYGLQQSGSNVPVGPMKLVIHMCSVWVPFISESKEAIAPYPEIVKEMKLAIQDAGRELLRYLSGKRRAGEQRRRLEIFDRYAIEIANSVSILTKKNEKEIEKKIKELIKDRAHIKDETTGENEQTTTNEKEEKQHENKKDVVKEKKTEIKHEKNKDVEKKK